jgi:hypothetical protein
MTDLETRLRRIEDRIEIEELLARYSNACDDRDMPALARCFAQDFEFDSVAGHSIGRDSAMAYYRERLGLYGVTLHVPHTLLLEVLDDDVANGVVASHAELELEGEMFMTAFRYHDHYVKEEGRWCFLSRRVEAFYAMPLRELSGQLDPLRLRWPNTEPRAAGLPEPLPTWDDFVRSKEA